MLVACSAACSSQTSDRGDDDPDQPPSPAELAGAQKATDDGDDGDVGTNPPAKLPPADAGTDPTKPATNADPFAPIVYVTMRDGQNGLWFCTGTLVASRKVVTAAHCLDPMFVSFKIIAPHAPIPATVVATNPVVFGQAMDFEDVAKPDAGFLTLQSPIALDAYAELTDVVARVDAGEALEVSAVVRTAEKPQAPLQEAAHLPLSSTVQYGYLHGFGTPMFTKGGDSGAGLFLIENGVRTNKLVGIARQPEPARGIDHFTRVDADFLAWFKANAAP